MYEAALAAFVEMILDLDNGDIQRLGEQITYTFENNLINMTLPIAQNNLERLRFWYSSKRLHKQALRGESLWVKEIAPFLRPVMYKSWYIAQTKTAYSVLFW